MKHVRGSEVSSFLRCRKQWKYSWIDNLEPKRQDNKLFFGNLAHKFFEAYYSNLNQRGAKIAYDLGYLAMTDLFQQTDTSGMPQTEIDELWDLASGVMDNYVKQWREADEGITVLATELRFAIPLDDETVYEGTIDMVYLDRDGRLFFKDYKNVASIERYVDMAEMDRQISRYWWALEQLARGNGYVWNDEKWEDVNISGLVDELKEPSGFFYDLILKDIPNVPEILKKGGLSVAKAQKTTYAIYLKKLDELGFIEIKEDGTPDFCYGESEKYREILDHLKAQETEFGNRFFRRIPVVRNDRETQAAMQEFMAVAEDMEQVRQFGSENSAYRNINADCSWCNYKALCVAEMDGSNAEMTKNLVYRQKEIKQNGESNLPI